MLWVLISQTTSKRLADRKIARFERNISKKGSESTKKGYPVGPILLGFFIFVVVGSCMFFPFFQIFISLLYSSILTCG